MRMRLLFSLFAPFLIASCSTVETAYEETAGFVGNIASYRTAGVGEELASVTDQSKAQNIRFLYNGLNTNGKIRILKVTRNTPGGSFGGLYNRNRSPDTNQISEITVPEDQVLRIDADTRIVFIKVEMHRLTYRLI